MKWYIIEYNFKRNVYFKTCSLTLSQRFHLIAFFNMTNNSLDSILLKCQQMKFTFSRTWCLYTNNQARSRGSQPIIFDECCIWSCDICIFQLWRVAVLDEHYSLDKDKGRQLAPQWHQVHFPWFLPIYGKGTIDDTVWWVLIYIFRPDLKIFMFPNKMKVPSISNYYVVVVRKTQPYVPNHAHICPNKAWYRVRSFGLTKWILCKKNKSQKMTTTS